MSDESFRAVFINSVHPDTAHVSGQRIPTFARLLAARGWRVLLLTPALAGKKGSAVNVARRAIASHDWGQPFHIAVPFEHRAQSGRWAPFRKLQSVVQLLSTGHRPEWPHAAKAFFPVIAEDFRPELVWSVFSVGDFTIAQRLSRYCRCPWAADFKDNYEAFIPKPFQRLVAARFSDLNGATSNAHLHATAAGRFFPVSPRVIYSGVAREMIASHIQLPERDQFRIMVVGGTYGKAEEICELVARWLDRLSSVVRSKVTLCYAGSDSELVRGAAAHIACQVDIRKYLPLTELGSLTRSAGVNIYLWSPQTFHHKTLELLASRRPVIAWGGEHQETLDLAAETGATVEVCKTDYELFASLDKALSDWLGGQVGAITMDTRSVTWEHFADRLCETLTSFRNGGSEHVRTPSTASRSVA